VPVGYAVKDTEVLLLDDDGNQAGVNEVGEIAVRSRYLSPGYWRKPDLTQAAFSSNTNGGDLRVYRTGDLGRMMSDGCLVHLGRKDFQVKIRGHRIELAEIEMALFSLGAIKETVVVAREDRPGDKRLVAYLVARSNPAPTVSAVRRALVEKLPDHMIPSAFVFLDALPQTTTGKVDRKALPPPSRKRPELETALVLPRTPVESALANIWSGVLGLDQVGADDNFLDLGGNSLAAIQVISRVIATFGVDLPLRSLFESSTLGEMGERIEAARWIQQGIQVGAGDPSVEREAGEL
jgi:acyl carrier protein